MFTTLCEPTNVSTAGASPTNATQDGSVDPRVDQMPGVESEVVASFLNDQEDFPSSPCISDDDVVVPLHASVASELAGAPFEQSTSMVTGTTNSVAPTMPVDDNSREC
ncbi:hypothetical protein V6N13_064030 [Hibiscus sabdariffa]|uniref:Uncharacterized protein n=1 Tax=Hibiscus sabdariffa TaxID=183260 RepID=A0ABR2R2F8_9ROSI